MCMLLLVLSQLVCVNSVLLWTSTFSILVLWIDDEIITRHMLCWVFMSVQVLCAFLLFLFASKKNEASAAMWLFIVQY